MKKNTSSLVLIPVLLALGAHSGCSSAPEVHKLQYADLKREKTFEYEFPVVWKAIETAVSHYKVLRRDPRDVNVVEMKRILERSMETDWIYGQSRDKYIDVKVDDLAPVHKALQTRVKFRIDAKKSLAGVHVVVETDEEIEELNSDGTSRGFSSVSDIDASRPNELLDKIGQSILAAPPI